MLRLTRGDGEKDLLTVNSHRMLPRALLISVILVAAISVMLLGYAWGRSSKKVTLPVKIKTLDPDRSLSTIRIPTSTSPIYVEMLADNPRVMLFHNFLSLEECQHLIALAEPRMARSTVQSKQLELSADRTSFTTNLLKRETDILKAIESRAVMFSGYPDTNLEPLQVVRYHPNQFYKPHYDYFVPGMKGTANALKRGGQRTITYFVYLNDLPPDEKGGATSFPKLGIKIRPKAGTAVYFNNLLPSGKEDDRLLHGGEPPEQSIKYGLNIWFRQGPFA